jgi:replicative superfamily II helicase
MNETGEFAKMVRTALPVFDGQKETMDPLDAGNLTDIDQPDETVESQYTEQEFASWINDLTRNAILHRFTLDVGGRFLYTIPAEWHTAFAADFDRQSWLHTEITEGLDGYGIKLLPVGSSGDFIFEAI